MTNQRPRPRLLYIITLPEIGGAQSHLLALIEGFRHRYELHLATSSVGPLTQAAEAHGVAVHLLPALARSINPLSDLAALKQCINLIRRVQPTFIHAHSSKAGLVSRIAGLVTRVPVIFTAHGWGFKPGVPAPRRWVVWASETLIAPLTQRIICVSHYDRQLALDYGVARGQSLVPIHNGLADDAPLAQPEAGPVNIMMTARFQEPKDQAHLLHAFAALRDPQARLTFVGGGIGLPTCQALAEQLGIAPHVHFLGDRSDVAKLLAEAHVFVLLSRYEGLPLSILEAMRAGLPVIASEVGGIPEEVEHAKTGYLVPTGDAAAVSRALATLLTQPALRREMGAAGRQKFLAEFSLTQMLEQTAAVYQQVDQPQRVRR